jgi:hypothetical protein
MHKKINVDIHTHTRRHLHLQLLQGLRGLLPNFRSRCCVLQLDLVQLRLGFLQIPPHCAVCTHKDFK